MATARAAASSVVMKLVSRARFVAERSACDSRARMMTTVCGLAVASALFQLIATAACRHHLRAPVGDLLGLSFLYVGLVIQVVVAFIQ